MALFKIDASNGLLIKSCKTVIISIRIKNILLQNYIRISIWIVFKTSIVTPMKIVTFILILVMLFKQLITVAKYVVFYDYIKNEVCVNKDKPELNCNGKCHLMKKMANVSKHVNSDKKHFSV